MFSQSSFGTLLATSLLAFNSLVSAVVLREEAGVFFDVEVQSGDELSPDGYPRCSPKWRYIGKELKHWFIDDDGYCTDLAAQAVRMPFHDCFVDGGCDGSIILSDECTTRIENRQLIPLCGVLYKMSLDYDVGAADLVNFAASIGNKACPLGPYIPFYIGRKNNETSGPPNQIPSPLVPAPQLIQIFEDKNFTATDLVAFVGAHSCGGNLSFVPFDTTPGELDSPTYYTEQEYARSQESWDWAYVKAMIKMITRENDRRFLYDCSWIVYDTFREDRDDEDRGPKYSGHRGHKYGGHHGGKYHGEDAAAW